ncbi:MAG: amidohydrolase [Thermomicrobiales bacterium]
MPDAHAPLRHDIDEILPGVIADRRHVHEHPEVAFHEHATAAFVADRLRALGVDEVRTGINGTGVTGTIVGTHPADGPTRTILFRSELDGLPVQEETGVPYASQVDGVSHACGHDGNIAALLAVARILVQRRETFAGAVKVLFQPAEELPPGGAKGMVEAGSLDDVDALVVAGISLFNDLGTVITSPGPILAAADVFTVTIAGTGGHAALPHQAIDPVVIAFQVGSALQTLVSREVDPMDRAVVSICSLHGGDAHNVIPETVTLAGTVRTFDPDVRAHIARRIGEIASGIAAASGASATLDHTWGYPVTVNDPGITQLVQEVAAEIVGPEHVGPLTPLLGGEDAAYYLQAKPGCYAFVGARNPAKGFTFMHHHPKFDFDEDVLAIDIELMVAVALRFLERGADSAT